MFEQIHQRRPDSVLLLAGQGETMDEIRQLVSQKGLDDAVKFLGIRKDIAHLMNAMDVFVLPSFLKDFPSSASKHSAPVCPS